MINMQSDFIKLKLGNYKTNYELGYLNGGNMMLPRHEAATIDADPNLGYSLPSAFA
jgi:hypothetical protein